MKRGMALFILLLSLGATPAYAQNENAGPGVVEVTLIPGGGTFFPSKGPSPSFGNYSLGASVTYNLTRLVGIEGEVSGALGISQNLTFGGVNGSVKTPNIVDYTGNVVVYAPPRSGFIPYATGGIGGLTVMKTAALGVNDMTTFFTGNAGGGVKWYANRRWGVRADYRFIVVGSKDDAPAFFGQQTRYGHRVYGGIIVNALR